ncbi:MAG: hypothetical protein WBB82_06395 [Limnothrix sp.]
MTLKEQMLEIVNQADEEALQQLLKLWQDIQKPQQKGFMRFSGILKDHADILMELEQEIDHNRALNLMTINADE